MMRWVVAALAVLAPAAGAGEAAAAEEERVLNAVVALVNNEPVTKLEVDTIVVEMLRDASNVTDEQVRAARERAREGLIQQKLLVQEARRRQIEVEPEAVNAEVERYKKMGIDAEDRRDLIRERLLVANLLRRLQSARSITPDQVAAYYRQHPDDFVLPERRHVFVLGIYASSYGGDKAKAKAEAEEILKRLKEGEDFAALARKHSDWAYADKGGDAGWLERGSLVEPLDAVAAKLKPGEVSDLIETDDGYLLVKVAGVQPPSRQSLAEARDQIEQRLLAQYRQKRRRQLIEQLKASASILRFDLEPAP
jgi:parvulin-like peptidyl-prolyl isomerase